MDMLCGYLRVKMNFKKKKTCDNRWEQIIPILSCCKKLVLPDSDIAEAMALKLGLEFARDMLFLKHNS